jgi:hypothetical protein
VPDARVKSGIRRVLTDNLRWWLTCNMLVNGSVTIQFPKLTVHGQVVPFSRARRSAPLTPAERLRHRNDRPDPLTWALIWPQLGSSAQLSAGARPCKGSLTSLRR